MLKGLQPRRMAAGKCSTAFNLRQNGYFLYKKENHCILIPSRFGDEMKDDP